MVVVHVPTISDSVKDLVSPLRMNIASAAQAFFFLLLLLLLLLRAKPKRVVVMIFAYVRSFASKQARRFNIYIIKTL